MGWTKSSAHGMWAHQLRDMAEEKRQIGDEAAARELERQAEQHQRTAVRSRRRGISR